MIRRFLSGVFWGGVVSALGLGAISQLTPLPVSRIAAEPSSVQLKKPGPVAPVVDTEAAVLPDAVVEPDLAVQPDPNVKGDAIVPPDAGVQPDAVVAPLPTAPETQVEPNSDAAPKASTPDAATPDVVIPDAVTPDAVTPDAATPDAVTPDASIADPAPATSAAVEQLDPPVGSEFAQPLPDVEPVLPVAETAPPVETADLAPLSPPASDAASMTDAPSAAPETGLEPPPPSMPPVEAELAVEPPVAVAPDQIALAEPAQPAAPQADLAPVPAQDPAPPAAPEAEDALLKPLPDILPVPEVEPALDVDPVPVDDPSPQIDPDAALVPQTDAENAATLAPTPGLEGQVDGVTIGRLPRIGDAALSEEAVTDAAIDADPTLTIETEQDLPPLQKYARSFENPDAKPLFSIILIDTGGAALDRAALAALPFPVTFALDPLAPEAAEASKIYRDAGQEVIMVATGIPAGATAADLEVTFQAHAAALPETVAVIDTEFGAFQADRPLATQVVPILQAQGRGLISWDRGLNAADQVARREGLAATMVFRKLDGKGENTAAVRRALDRAAFKAAQDGTVTVIGQTIPETVAALLEWAVEGRAASVALAPVSAVLSKP